MGSPACELLPTLLPAAMVKAGDLPDTDDCVAKETVADPLKVNAVVFGEVTASLAVHSQAGCAWTGVDDRRTNLTLGLTLSAGTSAMSNRASSAAAAHRT